MSLDEVFGKRRDMTGAEKHADEAVRRIRSKLEPLIPRPFHGMIDKVIPILKAEIATAVNNALREGP